jgi:hypothetical protein
MACISPSAGAAFLLRSITWLMPIDAISPHPRANVSNRIDFERMMELSAKRQGAVDYWFVSRRITLVAVSVFPPR